MKREFEDKYCHRHNMLGFIHPKHGCLKCLAMRQNRNYVPFEDFVNYWFLKESERLEKEKEKTNAFS